MKWILIILMVLMMVEIVNATEMEIISSKVNYNLINEEKSFIEKYIDISKERINETTWNYTFTLNPELKGDLVDCYNTLFTCNMDYLKQKWLTDYKISNIDLMNYLVNLKQIPITTNGSITISKTDVNYIDIELKMSNDSTISKIIDKNFSLLITFNDAGIVTIGSKTIKISIPNTNRAYSGALTENTYTITTDTGITALCYNQINVSDNVYCLEDEGSSSKDAYFAVNFTIPKNIAFNYAFITAEMKSTAASDVCQLTLYNYSASDWKKVNATAGACPSASETTLRYNITKNNLPYFVGNGLLQVMANTQGGSADDLNVDFISAILNFNASIWFSYSQTNLTTVFINNVVNHSAIINTSGNLTSYAFEWNASGANCNTLTNVTSGTIGGNPSIMINITQVIPSGCAGQTVGWKIYGNNSDKITNNTPMQTYNVYKYGGLIVNLTKPVNNSEYSQLDQFDLNATITCGGGNGALCGVVTALARYNLSGTTPNQDINTTNNANPLFIKVGGEKNDLILQVAETDNLEDTWVQRIDNPQMTGGSATNLLIDSTRDWRGYLKFNIINIPNNIIILNATLNAHSLCVSVCPISVNIHHVYNYTWIEDNLNHTNQPCGANFDKVSDCNLTANDRVAITATEQFYKFNVTNSVNSEYVNHKHNNISFAIEDDTGSYRQAYLKSKEYADTTLRPYLNITHMNPIINNPIIIPSLTNGESYNVSWTINITGTSDYDLDVLFNSTTYGETNIAKNNTGYSTVCIGDCGGEAPPVSQCDYVSGDYIISDGSNCVITTNTYVDGKCIVENGAIRVESGTLTCTQGCSKRMIIGNYFTRWVGGGKLICGIS